MDMTSFVGSVLTGELAPVAAGDEQVFHTEWVTRGLSLDDSFLMAARGGAIADRLAWVFVSGYQATIRRVFPDLSPEPGWASFVNTENPEAKLSGTTLEVDSSGNGTLRGWKTWVATSAHVSRLLVSSSQGRIPFAVVRRDQPGVEIETSPRKSYLGDMSQGRVQFHDVAVSADCIVGDERTFPVFRASESAYVRVALNAFMFAQCCRVGAPAELIARLVANLYGSQAVMAGQLPSDEATIALYGIHMETVDLAFQFQKLLAESDPDLQARWLVDRRLVDGVTVGLASRAAQALSQRRP